MAGTVVRNVVRQSALERKLRAEEPRQNSTAKGARIHKRFAALYRRHYGTSYERTFAADGFLCARLVREYGRNEAYYLVARAFREPLLAHFGITLLARIVTWAPFLAKPPDGTGSRVPQHLRAPLRAYIAEHGEKSIVHAGRLH